MIKLKSFNELSGVTIPRAEKVVVPKCGGKSKTVSNSSQMADSHYYKNVCGCNATEVLLVNKEEKTTEIVVIPQFLFPNQIRREYQSKLKAFRWTGGTKNSKTYTQIIGSNKVIREEKVTLYVEFIETENYSAVVEKTVNVSEIDKVFEGRELVEERLKTLFSKVSIQKYESVVGEREWWW
jgi:hypothetical protein